MVYDFYGSKYASCLARLQRMLPVLRLDIFLSPHVEALYEAVRGYMPSPAVTHRPKSLLKQDEAQRRYKLRKQGHCIELRYRAGAGTLQGTDTIHNTLRVSRPSHNGRCIRHRCGVSAQEAPLLEHYLTDTDVCYLERVKAAALPAPFEAPKCRVLEKELADLISSGEVQARIDSHAKVLYARLTDARAVAYENALKFGATRYTALGLLAKTMLHPVS